jgi:hypothetical protein
LVRARVHESGTLVVVLPHAAEADDFVDDIGLFSTVPATAPKPVPGGRARTVFRPRRSPSLIPASRRLMRGGFRPWSERVDVDHGERVARRLDDVTIVMGLDYYLEDTHLFTTQPVPVKMSEFKDALNESQRVYLATQTLNSRFGTLPESSVSISQLEGY